MQLVIQKIVPATIESNINQLDSYITELQNRYANVIVTEEFIAEGKEDRAKLNKLKKNLADERKKIEKDGLSDVQKFILKIKEAEKTVGNLSDNINNQIKEFEEKEKKEKLDWIESTINVEIIDNAIFQSLKKYIIHNPKWLNKTFSYENITKEIIEQIKKLNEKCKFILAQLSACNEEIENKLSFDDIESKFDCPLDEILKYILEKKNQIKTTEDNMKKKAEEDKQKAIQEAAEKAEKEKQKAIEEAKEEERKKINQNIEAHENTEIYRKTDDIEKNESLTAPNTVKNVTSDMDYVALVIKIKNSDIKKAIKLKNFLDSEDIKLEYEKYIIPSFTDEKIYIGKDQYYEDVAEENGLIHESEEYSDSRRWSIVKTIYYKREKDGRMFAYWQEEPATEKQEGGDFSKSDCFYEIKQDIKMKY